MDKTNFNPAIDGLDENTLREFHNNLIKNGCYDEHLNPDTIDETNINQLRQAVKVGVQSTNYEKLIQFAPPPIKAQIEAMEVAGRQIVQPEVPEPRDEPISEKEKLLQELVKIADQRDRRKRIPPSLRPRYLEIITQLTQIHNMTFKDIDEISGIDRQTLSKDADNYIKDHPIVTPDQKVLDKTTTHAVDTLSKVVGQTADRIIEEDMELAIHIRQTYLKESYLRGMTLRQLVDMAIPRYFKSDDIYNTMLDMESKNIDLRNRNEELEQRVAELTSRNKYLNQTLMHVNSIRS